MLELVNTLIDVEAGKKYEISVDEFTECPIDMAGYGRVMGAFTGAGTFGEDLKGRIDDWQNEREELIEELEECHRDYMVAEGEWIKAYVHGNMTEEREVWQDATLERTRLQDLLADLEEHDNNRPNLMVISEPSRKYFGGCDLFVDIDGILEETGLKAEDVEGVARSIHRSMVTWLSNEVYRVDVYDWCGDVDIQEWNNDGQPSDVEDWKELESIGGVYDLNYYDLESVKNEIKYYI